MQGSYAVHLGLDHLNVVRHVSRILDGHVGRKPFELSIDGDLLALIEKMILQRGVESVRISKIKGHADDVKGMYPAPHIHEHLATANCVHLHAQHEQPGAHREQWHGHHKAH